jgi:hypothetical protein
MVAIDSIIGPPPVLFALLENIPDIAHPEGIRVCPSFNIHLPPNHAPSVSVQSEAPLQTVFGSSDMELSAEVLRKKSNICALFVKKRSFFARIAFQR